MHITGIYTVYVNDFTNEIKLEIILKINKITSVIMIEMAEKNWPKISVNDR